MRAKFLLISTISVLSMSVVLYSSKAQADDSIIDLSVLDSLGSESSSSVRNAPLFPVVSSDVLRFPEVKNSRAKKAKKAKITKKAASAKKTPVQKKAAPVAGILLPSKKDVSVEIEKKTDLPIVNGKYADSPFGIVHDEPVKVETTSAPIAPVDIKVEELPPVENKVSMEPINGMTELPGSEPTEQKELISPAVLDGASPLPSTEAKPAASESLFNMTDEQLTPTAPVIDASVAEEPRPLVDISPAVPLDLAANLTPAAAAGGEIAFVAESDVLSDDGKKQIDAIIAGFEDAHSNKIAIYSYNLDTGKDVFRRKRLSLNRAVEVRSYLLNLGYKNFSIKVVNITDDNGKADSVTIEELK